MDVATSPVRHKENASKKSAVPISIDTCKVGETVLVVWNPQYEMYTIFQPNSNYMFFLHIDCVEPLGLKPSNEPRKMCCIGEVTNKEYCHAKKVNKECDYDKNIVDQEHDFEEKDANRFKVPKGTRFYRIRVRQLPPREPSAQPQMSQSQITESIMTESQISSQSVPVTPTKVQSSLMSESTSTLQEATVDGAVTDRSQMLESTTASVLYESSIESAASGSGDTNLTEDVNR